MSLGINSENRKWGIVFAAFLLISATGLVTMDQMILRDSKILPNVHVAYIDVGGLSPETAEQKLRESALVAASLPILATDQSSVWFIEPSDIDFAIDLKRSVAAAYDIGRKSSLFQRWRERILIQDKPILLPVHIELNRNKLIQSLAKLSDFTDRTARDSALLVLLKTRSVALIPGQEGRRLDPVKTASKAFSTPPDQLAFVIDLVFEKQLPKIPDSHFSGINTMLSSFSTYFKPWDYDRNANLRLAASRIHGTILKPGEVFSYNKNVGHRTQKDGFKMAPVILDGKLVPDWGGGVCQVSSTLYNAVLLADMDIVDRSNHGRAIGYVPLGFDATVVDGYIDFKFKNNLKRPVMIHTQLKEDELVFSILGDTRDVPPPIELEYVVHKVIEPVEIKQSDPTLEIGKEVVEETPQRGFRVSTYRIRTIDGKQERQLLSTDDYDPVNRIVKIGAKIQDGVSPAKGIPPKALQLPQGTPIQGQGKKSVPLPPASKPPEKSPSSGR